MNIAIKKIDNGLKVKGDLRDKCGGYGVFVEEVANVNHYWSYEAEDKLCILFGSLYLKVQEKNKAEYVWRYLNSGKELYDIDGSFLYFIISRNGDITAYSEREGLHRKVLS